MIISPSGAELIKDRGIIFEGQTWKYQGCDFYFPGTRLRHSCPVMTRPVCNVYNGYICCASHCPGMLFINPAFQVRHKHWQIKHKDVYTYDKHTHYLTSASARSQSVGALEWLARHPFGVKFDIIVASWHRGKRNNNNNNIYLYATICYLQFVHPSVTELIESGETLIH